MARPRLQSNFINGLIRDLAKKFIVHRSARHEVNGKMFAGENFRVLMWFVKSSDRLLKTTKPDEKAAVTRSIRGA